MKTLSFLLFLILSFVACPGIRAQAKTSVELPMKMRGLMPAVEVMVNGKGPFLFAIDTGGQGQARLDSTLVEKLGLKPTGEARASDGSGTNARVLPTFEVDSIDIGGIKFNKLTALSRSYNAPDAPVKIDGILGFGLFVDHLLTLDYPGRKVKISTGVISKSDGQNIIEFDNSRGIVVVDLTVGKQTIKAHLDSGNMNGGFMLPTDLVEKSPLLSEAVVVGRAKTISSEVEIKQVKMKDTIKLGTLEFKEPTVNFPSFGSANIGGKVLNELVLTFDQKNKLIKFG
jgi:hypothetical protein